MQPLLKHLRASGALSSPDLYRAFKAIDRADFVLPEYRSAAYDDRPLPIGHGQTISQPSTVAFMLQLLQPAARQRVLDVGSGSGWTTALLAAVTGASGSVLGKEIIPELVAQGNENLERYHFRHATIAPAQPGVLGDPSSAPFDRILVSASARTYPETLAQQLCVGGILVIPVRSAIWKVVRTETGTEISKHPNFIFVPLIQ